MTAQLVLDSAKFLNAVNNSAQSRVAAFEGHVRALGQKSKQNLRLVSLHNDRLFMENVDTNEYFVAKHRSLAKNRVEIHEVKPIKIVEEQKSALFEQNCRNLVGAIESNDPSGMRAAWQNLSGQRFSSRTVPLGGMVRTRDGQVRKLKIASEVMPESAKQRLITAIVESVTDTVQFDGKQIISATFGEDSSSRIPISELACRRATGNKMRKIASEAFKSPGFQTRILKLASLVNDDKLEEAVKSVGKFLKEEQEFCLLTKKEVLRLIENTLATKAILNQRLCEDVATLFYRTNMKINRSSIVSEWLKVAQRAGNPLLLENTHRLERAKDFNGSYDNFLNAFFVEALSPRDEELNAYRTALDLLRQTPRLQEDHELRTQVDELMDKLNDRNVDDATVQLVRETLSAAKREVDSLNRLGDFDEVPGDDLSDDISDAVNDPDVGDGTPTIVINAPLISIGGEGGADAGLDDLGGDDLGGDDLGGEDDLGGDDLDLGGDDDLDLGGDSDLDDLGGGDDLDLGDEDEEDDLGLDLASVQRKSKPVLEDEEFMKKILAKKGKKDGDSDDDDSEDDSSDDSGDRYAFEEQVSFKPGMGSDYGFCPLTNERTELVSKMYHIADERGISESDLSNVADELAQEALVHSGIKIPANRMSVTIETLAGMFLDSLREDQFKWGRRKRRGFGRSSIKAHKKGVAESKNPINWLEHDAKAQGLLGEAAGVKFLLDYASPCELVNEDQSIRIPVPTAVASEVKSVLENRTAPKLNSWLLENIEQLRPASAEEDDAINEALASIVAHGDGTIEVSVDGDVQMMPAGGEMPPDEMEPVVDAPVDAMGPPMDAPMGPEDEVMPDFEAGADLNDEETSPDEDSSEGPDSDVGDAESSEDAEGDEESEEEPVTEDHDVTDPSHKDYIKAVKEDPRKDSPEAGKGVKAGDGKKLDGFSGKVGKADLPSTPGMKHVKPSKENRVS